MPVRPLLLSALLASLPAALVGCAKSEDTGEAAETGADGGDGGGEACEPPASTTADEPACQEDYSLCGDILPPADFSGTPRSLGLALYASIPPQGMPDAILGDIPLPVLAPCERFPIVLQPMLETGDYYLWVNVYMDGGGSFIPVNDIDYTGASAAPLSLTGAPFLFEDIGLTLASGW